jgi:hypothetical protein
MAKTDEYRERAEECRRKPETAMATRDKEAWLKVVELWLQLSQQANTSLRPEFESLRRT